METPRGLIILESSLDTILIPHSKREVALGEAREIVKRIIVAIDLMKEMAEALGAYANDSFDATSLGDFDDEGHGKLARTVLKKFKEWK